MNQTVDVDELRNKYPNPSVSKGYHNSRGQYSVGGALLIHIGESSSIDCNFPGYKQVAKKLAKLNPGLDLGIAEEWALFIMELNNEAKFNQAFNCLESALEADSSPNKERWLDG